MLSTVLIVHNRAYTCVLFTMRLKNQNMTIWLAIGPLILILLFHFMLKAAGTADTMFCDFANWAPSGLKTVLLKLILIFWKKSRMKLLIKCWQNDANKVCIAFMEFRKIDKFYCTPLFFVEYICIYIDKIYVNIFAHHFWLICNRVMALDWCRIPFPFNIFRTNGQNFTKSYILIYIGNYYLLFFTHL